MAIGKKLNGTFRKFIEAQQMFFVATAAPEGRVNLSPKGLDSLRILDDNRIVWLSLSGSGNETAAHLLENPRMTLMFMAMQGNPLILRLYGTARVLQNLEMSGVPPEEVGDAALPWLETMVYDHRESDSFADGLDQLSQRAKAIGVKRARTLFEAAVSETKRRKNRAHAIVGLGDLLADQPGEADQAKARELFELAISEYDDTAAGERAVEMLAGLALRPGKPAPNFEASTIDGHSFQLSDYEGKVVLLDFYGFW